VSNDLVFIKDLSSSNGTTVNGIRIQRGIELIENDLIGIYGGYLPLSDLDRNHGFFVYRLRQYSTNNLPTIEIKDDVLMDLSESDDDDVICLGFKETETIEINDDDDDDECELQLMSNSDEDNSNPSAFDMCRCWT